MQVKAIRECPVAGGCEVMGAGKGNEGVLACGRWRGDGCRWLNMLLLADVLPLVLPSWLC